MRKSLVFGEIAIALVAGLAGVVFWTIAIQLPFVVPAIAIGLLALARPSAVHTKKWLRRTLHVTSVVNACSCLYFGVSLIGSHAEPERYVVRTGYAGWVVIVFDRPQGQAPEYDGSRRVYRVPENGILVTQFSSNDGWTRTLAQYQDQSGKPTTSVESTVSVGSWSDTRCSLTYARLWIGPGPPRYFPDPMDRVSGVACSAP